MKPWYLRVMPSDTNSKLDEDSLLIENILSAFEDASLDRPLEKHPRGGYSLFIMCSEGDRIPFIEALSTSGFNGCI